MPNKIRWGIISTGFISTQFATGLSVIPEAKLVAVGSRSLGSANEFGDKFNVPRRYASYEELAGDLEVDVVYIGTPHPFHKENSLLCLEAGKAGEQGGGGDPERPDEPVERVFPLRSLGGK